MTSTLYCSFMVQAHQPRVTKLVKQRYGPELLSRTLVSLKPEISEALDSLVNEIDCKIKAMRASATSDHPL